VRDTFPRLRTARSVNNRVIFAGHKVYLVQNGLTLRQGVLDRTRIFYAKSDI